MLFWIDREDGFVDAAVVRRLAEMGDQDLAVSLGALTETGHKQYCGYHHCEGRRRGMSFPTPAVPRAAIEQGMYWCWVD